MQSRGQRAREGVVKSTLPRRGLPLYRDEHHEHVPLGAELSHPRVRCFPCLPTHERAVFDIDRPQLAAEPIEFPHLIPRLDGR
jgi:hypothetical protein